MEGCWEKGETINPIKFTWHTVTFTMPNAGLNSNKLLEVARYEPKAGDRIRILINYEKHWRPVFWVQVSKDGSVYLGPRMEKVKQIKKGSKIIKNKITSINYNEGIEINDLNKSDLTKVSFHASGIVHTVDEKLFRKSLRRLKKQEELCHLLFLHPSHFATIKQSEIKKRDICLNYPINQECPLAASLYVSPLNNCKTVKIIDANYQINLMLNFSGVNDLSNLLLQIVLYHKIPSVWPPFNYIVFRAKSKSL
jgi:hypothetical protein